MKTNKIFAAAMAGLCAVSAIGISAFAADDTEKIEAAGEKAYKITAGFQAPTMDVTVPSEIKGVINPYMIAVELDGVAVVEEGVASPRYAITNNSADIGVKVNATYSADGLDGIVETADAATDATKNTKGKKLAWVTLNAALGTGEDAETVLTMTTKETTTTDPILELTENGGANDAGEIWLGGAVPETPAEKWTANDKLTINVVLDLVPYNTGAGGPSNTSNDAPLTALTLVGGGLGSITFTAPADFTAASSKTMTATATQASNIVQVTPTFTVAAGSTVTGTYSVDGGSSQALTSGTQATITSVNAGSTIVFTFVTDDGAGNGTTYTVTTTVA